MRRPQLQTFAPPAHRGHPSRRVRSPGRVPAARRTRSLSSAAAVRPPRALRGISRTHAQTAFAREAQELPLGRSNGHCGRIWATGRVMAPPEGLASHKRPSARHDAPSRNGGATRQLMPWS